MEISVRIGIVIYDVGGWWRMEERGVVFLLFYFSFGVLQYLSLGRAEVDEL